MKRICLSMSFGAILVTLCCVPILLSCANRTENRKVSVLYAGSLATVMENGLGPAFAKASGYEYQGEAQGSLGAARMIHDRLRSPDVFISADPSVNEKILMGSQNGELVTWFLTLASSQLVLAYNPSNKFVDKFKAAEAGTLPWYEVLKTPGLRFGRGDPRTDPKGYRTLFLFELAGKHYQRPELPGLLGDPINPDQVFPETVLLARVQSGQFDAGIFYKHEVVAHKLPFVSFSPEINLGDPKFSAAYAQTSYTTPSGEHVVGAPILFTITIPRTVKNKVAAEAFVRFMLTSNDLLKEFGLGNVEHRAGGDITQAPAELRSLSAGKYEP
jgi:molybdate/tungstate transport system substrate-binding protein